MSGFVVCKACGTRIKAGRGHCLRCFAPLPDPDVPVRPPLSESLGLSRNQGMLFAAGTAVAVVLLAMVIWQTWPVPADDEAQPASALTAACRGIVIGPELRHGCPSVVPRRLRPSMRRAPPLPRRPRRISKRRALITNRNWLPIPRTLRS